MASPLLFAALDSLLPLHAACPCRHLRPTARDLHSTGQSAACLMNCMNKMRSKGLRHGHEGNTRVRIWQVCTIMHAGAGRLGQRSCSRMRHRVVWDDSILLGLGELDLHAQADGAVSESETFVCFPGAPPDRRALGPRCAPNATCEGRWHMRWHEMCTAVRRPPPPPVDMAF